MDASHNPFKQALLAGRPQIGLWLGLADPYSAEICAGAGFDWLLIDAEHSPNDLRTILAHLQALAAYPVAPLVRPPVGDAVLIKQLLDIGVRNLLVPMVESAGQAAAMVAATRYPPNGIRGVGSPLARASGWNRTPEYVQRANAGICLTVQIESRLGLERLEEIAGVEGVDGVFVGPLDLGASLGHLGQPGHPEVLAAIEGAFERLLAVGKAPGILVSDEAMARHYLELGGVFVAVGVDTTLLARATSALAAAFKTPEVTAEGPGGGVR